MSDQVRSSRFQALFESALRDYEQKAKMTLSKHPLAEKLEKCDSVESITGLLLDQAPTLGNSQGSDKMRRSIKSTISVLYALSATAVFGDATGLVRQNLLKGYSVSLILILQSFKPAKAIHTGLGVLLAVRFPYYSVISCA